MTDAASALIEPLETAPPPCGGDEDSTRAMLRRELEVLGELAELGLQMARTIARQAGGEETAHPAFQGDLALAFSRVSRAVRMAVLLQAKLIHDLKGVDRKASPSDDEEDVPIRWEVQWVDEITGKPVRDEGEERDETSAERMEGEARERLDRDDVYAAVMGLPKEEVIERIRQDLGVALSPVDGGEVGSGDDGSAAVWRTGHPHPQPSDLLVYEPSDPHRGGGESSTSPVINSS